MLGVLVIISVHFKGNTGKKIRAKNISGRNKGGHLKVLSHLAPETLTVLFAFLNCILFMKKRVYIYELLDNFKGKTQGQRKGLCSFYLKSVNLEGLTQLMCKDNAKYPYFELDSFILKFILHTFFDFVHKKLQKSMQNTLQNALFLDTFE